jgi:hypothetical protein
MIPRPAIAVTDLVTQDKLWRPAVRMNDIVDNHDDVALGSTRESTRERPARVDAVTAYVTQLLARFHDLECDLAGVIVIVLDWRQRSDISA